MVVSTYCAHSGSKENALHCRGIEVADVMNAYTADKVYILNDIGYIASLITDQTRGN
jgi:hypothetical protein